MSSMQALLAQCSTLGIALSSGADGTLKVKAPTPIPEDLREELKNRKTEILSFLQGHKGKEGCTDSSSASTAARLYLPRPLGQEKNPEVWEVWKPLLRWLRQHSLEQLRAIWETEKTLRDCERKGDMQSAEYQKAIQALVKQFNAGRRLKMRAFVKVWTQ